MCFASATLQEIGDATIASLETPEARIRAAVRVRCRALQLSPDEMKETVEAALADHAFGSSVAVAIAFGNQSAERLARDAKRHRQFCSRNPLDAA